MKKEEMEEEKEVDDEVEETDKEEIAVEETKA